MPRLIVNADDLGLTPGVNRAIVQAFQRGIVTSATLMANAPAFSEAVSLLSVLPEYQSRELSIGCHIVLVDGTPLSPPETIPSLLDPAESSPRFYKKLWKFALASVRGKISAREVELEASAQVQRLQRSGVAVSHLDCHKHSHMFPPVLEGVLRAAATHGIRCIRNPFEPSFARSSRIKFSGNALRSAETALLNQRYARVFREAVQSHGLFSTDGCVGVTVTGSLDLNLFAETIRTLPREGSYEFLCHPGYNDNDLSSAGTRLLQSRETELAALCSPEAREELKSAHVEIINFWNLVTGAESKPVISHPMP